MVFQISIAAAARWCTIRSAPIAVNSQVWAPEAPHSPILPLQRSALPRDTVALARFLLGKLLVRELNGSPVVGRIVETEAYLQNDPACHAFRGMTPRNNSPFLSDGPPFA